MKIKSIVDCYTIDPNIKWSAGEFREVDEKVAEKLLRNKNFIKEPDNTPVYKTREMVSDKINKK
jgi:hypothetical protein